MNILALDLGTRCGWAKVTAECQSSGVRNLGIRASEAPGQRWLRFRQFLGELEKQAGEIHVVYFEELIHFPGNTPATVMMFGGYRAHLETWCVLRNLPLHVVNVSTIKKHWTGKGNAKKPDMMRVARERGLNPKDDNEADALALLDYAMCEQGRPTATAIEAAADAAVVANKGSTWIDPFKAAA